MGAPAFGYQFITVFAGARFCCDALGCCPWLLSWPLERDERYRRHDFSRRPERNWAVTPVATEKRREVSTVCDHGGTFFEDVPNGIGGSPPWPLKRDERYRQFANPEALVFKTSRTELGVTPVVTPWSPEKRREVSTIYQYGGIDFQDVPNGIGGPPLRPLKRDERYRPFTTLEALFCRTSRTESSGRSAVGPPGPTRPLQKETRGIAKTGKHKTKSAHPTV